MMTKVIELLNPAGTKVMHRFWNVCTRPISKNGLGLSSTQTDERAKLLEERLRVLPDNEHVLAEWRRLVVEYSVAGVEVHDARLVASMIVHGVSHLLTLNDRDFVRYGSITVLHPRAVLGIRLGSEQ